MIDNEFLEFDEIESFYHELEKSSILLCSSLKDDFSIEYCPHSYEEAGLLFKDYYQLRLKNSYLKLHRNCVGYKSSHTNGWVIFDFSIKLKELVNVVSCSFDLELLNDDSCCSNIVLAESIDNTNYPKSLSDYLNEDIIIEYDIEKIKKTFHKYEVLRLFL